MSEEENKEEENQTNEDLIDIVKEFLKDTNLKEVIDSFNVSRIERFKTQDKSSGRNLKFWQYRYLKEFFIVLCILSVILVLSMYDKLDNSTLGTLLGSLIGYAVGNIGNMSNKN